MAKESIKQIENIKKRLGFRRQSLDIRDRLFMPLHSEPASLPPRVDLRSLCPPIVDQKDIGSCHDAQTEVLTDTGWKLFADTSLEDKFATVDPKTGKLIFEHPIKLIRFDYSGVIYKGKHEALDFAVTPDHKMLVRKWNEAKRTLEDEYVLVEMKDIGWYAGLMNSVSYDGEGYSDTYTLNGVNAKHKPQREDKIVSMSAWLKFLGIYLAEGTMRKQQKGMMYKIQIAGFKEREKEFIRGVLDELGQKYYEQVDRFSFDNQRIYSALAELGLRGVKAAHKFVPEFVFRLTGEQMKDVILGHFMGDGCEQNGLKSHYTGSPRLADDIQRLIFLSGGWGNIGTRPPRNSVMKDGRVVNGKCIEHRVSSWTTRNLSIQRKKQTTTENYEGEVFCAEVPTYHTLVTRRNGKILISGNCVANATASAFRFALRKQQRRDFQPSRLFLYYNARALQGWENEDSGAYIRDGFKSIGKDGVCYESSYKYDVSKFKEKPPARAYKTAETHQAIEYFSVTQTLQSLKACIADGFPFVFGFSVFDSFARIGPDGIMPYPQTSEKLLGGHAVYGCSYNDDTQLFTIANSWNVGFGDKGYFYMPYSVITNRNLASDFWCVKVTE